MVIAQTRKVPFFGPFWGLFWPFLAIFGQFWAVFDPLFCQKSLISARLEHGVIAKKRCFLRKMRPIFGPFLRFFTVFYLFFNFLFWPTTGILGPFLCVFWAKMMFFVKKYFVKSKSFLPNRLLGKNKRVLTENRFGKKGQKGPFLPFFRGHFSLKITFFYDFYKISRKSLIFNIKRDSSRGTPKKSQKRGIFLQKVWRKNKKMSFFVKTRFDRVLVEKNPWKSEKRGIFLHFFYVFLKKRKSRSKNDT